MPSYHNHEILCFEYSYTEFREIREEEKKHSASSSSVIHYMDLLTGELLKTTKIRPKDNNNAL